MKGCLTAGSDSYFYLVLNYSRPDAFLHGVWYSHILKLYVLIGAYGYYLGHWMWASRFVHLFPANNEVLARSFPSFQYVSSALPFYNISRRPRELLY